SIVRAIDLVGNLAYVAAGDVFILDVSEPARPGVVGSYPLARPRGLAGATGIAVSGSAAYLTDGHLVVLDISTPRAPRMLAEQEGRGPLNFGGDARATVGLQGVVLGGTEGSGGRYSAMVRVMERTDATQPRELGRYSVRFDSQSPAVAVQDDLI